MASKTGVNTNVILKQGSTHGTAVSGGSGDKLPIETISLDKSKTALTSNGIGTGKSMDADPEFSSGDATTNLTMQAGYNNGADTLIALFMGASTSSPSEQTSGQGDYLHTVTYDGTVSKFATIARDTSSATVQENPSAYPSSLSFSINRDEYLILTADFVADQRKDSSTTNTNASMASATISDTKKVKGLVDEAFRVNAQSGSALASGDIVCPSAISWTLGDPKQAKKCFSGSSSDGAPIRNSLFSGEISLTFLETEDHTWVDWFNNETKLKADFDIEGSQIGSGLNYQFKFNVPEMVVSSLPMPLASSGLNGFTVTCKFYEASSNPSGMSDTTPYFEIINTQSTALIS